MKQIKRTVLVIVTMLLLLSGCQKQGETNLQAGMKAIQQLKYEDALKCFEAAAKNKEDERLTARGKGLAYMGLTQYAEAVGAFKEALTFSNGRVDDLDYDINYYMAVSFYKSGDLQAASDALSAIIALRPKEIDAYMLRGTVLLELGKYKEAVADFEKTISFNPKDYDLLVDIYAEMERNGYKEEGKAYLTKAIKAEDNTMTDAQRGMIAYYLEDYENARNSLEKARASGEEKTILLLGKTYEALGDMNYASTVYTEYIEKNPKSIAVSNQLALSKMNAKDYEGALTAIESAMKIENNDMMQVLKFNEIIANEYLGDFKKATVLMESYLSVYPDDEKAKREYEFLKTR